MALTRHPSRLTAAPAPAALAVLVLLLVGLASCAATEAAGRRPPGTTGRWAIDHRDTFDGAALDGSAWGTCFWWGPEGCTIASNDEAQWYEQGQVSVSDGALRLRAEPRRAEHDGQAFTFASGMVSSGRPGDELTDDARYAFTYGYVEVRFRTPVGRGLWPAIWMLPASNDSRPEIDLLEQYGDDTSAMSMTLHSGTRDDPRVDRQYEDVPDLSEGWHTVGLEWTKGRLRWFVDGDERHRVEGDQVPSEPMYLVANLAVGGNAGEPDPAAFPATFLIDEVTVWRQQ